MAKKPEKPSKVTPKPAKVTPKAPKKPAEAPKPTPKAAAPVAAILGKMSKAMVNKMDKAVKDRGAEFNSPFFG